MYATLAYDVFSGSEPVADVRQAIADVFQDRDKLDLLAEVFICRLNTTAEYLELVRDLRRVSSDFPGQFEFVFTLHRKGDPLKSNAGYSQASANAIIDGSS
jgi:hypothetical protein